MINQAVLTMRWPKKREMVVYYLLWRKFKEKEFTPLDAYACLEPYFSRKVARSTLRYLSRVGLLLDREGRITIVPLDEFLSQVSYPYLLRRAILRRRTRG
ncbi:MAG: hypothetical protein RXS23_01295 [Metallosphaera yellowstonensis]|jgi:hypothetical protein|uniref:Uncharacterized protein n=1 Tax=Metallosphaera yellowstonensis MK1 TaxID=671065 RepID=H2C8I4_9CREN|nr:hypothetical protein [Metallosphaera yellowstonensis]EHP68460.1 hypothetical protein MetMK1DRAFT_00028940 [Metallosphaera yellowstonensis MK1]